MQIIIFAVFLPPSKWNWRNTIFLTLFIFFILLITLKCVGFCLNQQQFCRLAIHLLDVILFFSLTQSLSLSLLLFFFITAHLLSIVIRFYKNKSSNDPDNRWHIYMFSRFQYMQRKILLSRRFQRCWSSTKLHNILPIWIELHIIFIRLSAIFVIIHLCFGHFSFRLFRLFALSWSSHKTLR